MIKMLLARIDLKGEFLGKVDGCFFEIIKDRETDWLDYDKIVI